MGWVLTPNTKPVIVLKLRRKADTKTGNRCSEEMAFNCLPDTDDPATRRPGAPLKLTVRQEP